MFPRQVASGTILEQIEGAMLYQDTVSTRADEMAYKRMRLVLTSPLMNCTTACTSRGFIKTIHKKVLKVPNDWSEHHIHSCR